MKEARLKKDAKNKTIKHLLESPQVRRKYNIFMVVHWLLVVIFDHTKYKNVLEPMMSYSGLKCSVPKRK